MDPTGTVVLPPSAVWGQAGNLTDTAAKKPPISERPHSETPPPSNAESSVSRIAERMESLEQTVSDLQAEKQLLEECREDDAAMIQHLRGQLEKQWQRTVHLTASLVAADCAETAGRQARQHSSCCFGSPTDLGKGSRSAEKNEQHKLRLIVAQLEDEVEREREAAAKQRAALLTSVDTAESAAEELLAQSKLWENRCEILESRMEQQKQMMVARLIQAQGSWQ